MTPFTEFHRKLWWAEYDVRGDKWQPKCTKHQVICQTYMKDCVCLCIKLCVSLCVQTCAQMNHFPSGSPQSGCSDLEVEGTTHLWSLPAISSETYAVTLLSHTPHGSTSTVGWENHVLWRGSQAHCFSQPEVKRLTRQDLLQRKAGHVQRCKSKVNFFVFVCNE